ncbi:hypothetical protein BH10ACT3_BH10ACT3_08580 [soil metagenome]
MFAAAGKHLLVEKPLALNERGARTMVSAAQAAHVFFMEAMWSRFLPGYRILSEVIADGEIGEPLVVEADFGFRAPMDEGHRLFNRELGGGALLDLGIYPLNLCSMVLGVPDKIQATGVVGQTGVDEVVAALLHHPNNSIGVVKAASRVGLACTARISGSRGWIDLPAWMHDPRHLRVMGKRGDRVIEADYEGDGLRFEIDEVHRCIAAGLVECPTMPAAESIALAQRMDHIRGELGVTYPGE